MNEFEKSITSAKQKITSIVAGQRGDEPESNLEAATRIAATSQAASEAAKGKEPLNRKERSHYNQLVKPEEETALKSWAKENNLWINDNTVQHLAKQYVDEGAEQKVYLKEDGRFVIKINTGIFHGTWLELFNRLIIHYAIFPSTAYKLKGFTDANNQLCVVIEQSWVQVERGASKEEVSNYLNPLGFINTKFSDYYNARHGIILEDLHDENVFVSSANSLLFVDPVIYLETPDLGLKGKSLFTFPFNKK